MAKITDEEILNLIADRLEALEAAVGSENGKERPGPAAWLPVSAGCSRRKCSPARTWPPVQPIS